MPQSVENAPWFDAAWKGGAVSPRAFAVLAGNPSWETFEGTNTWILHEPGNAECYVVDPGPHDEQHAQSVRDAVEGLGCETAAILITHRHPDHAEGAGLLSRVLDAPVLARADGNLPDGPLRVGRAPELLVVPLPGHSVDSVGFVFPEDASVVTGDVIFQGASSAIIWPDGNLKDYFQSLDMLEDLVIRGVCSRFLSAHRRPVEDCMGAIDDYRKRRAMRLDQLRESVRVARTVDIDKLIPMAYGDVDPMLYPMCRLSIKAQLVYLQQVSDTVLDGYRLDF